MLGVMVQPIREREIPALHDRAADNLDFIRSAMERASSFTGVPGWGGVTMGVTAIGASVLAARAGTVREWLAIWLAEAALAGGIGIGAMVLKVRRAEGYFLTRPARRFLLSYLPPFGAAMVLTLVLVRAGLVSALPGTWLLLYGTALLTGGAFSVRIVPVMGACFVVAGLAAFATSPAFGDWWMAIGFGGLHLIFGYLIARRHGG